jgi:crotonobetainyl-CoA:carnitine CoA-transferase CaiB-like acyl-CoA transferase
MQPLSGMLVVDLSRYLPGAFASRELLELGARVVCIEPPGGDPLRSTAPAWDAALRAGKESLELDLKRDPAPALGLLREADVVLESFRPGVASRLGVGQGRSGTNGLSSRRRSRWPPRAARGRPQLPGLGAWRPPALPPVQIADFAAGALGAVTRILAALLERDRTGKGGHVVVSMTHGSHRLVAHRLGGDAVPCMLTGGLASYRIYETGDGRHLTVAPLEPVFFRRLTELLGRPELAQRQFDADQEALAAELAAIFAARPLAEWLEVFDKEDVCVGPVATIVEAATDLA